MSDVLRSHLSELANLYAQAAILAAPFDAHIAKLEVEKADTLHEITWAIDTLKAVIKPLILAAKRTHTMQGLTVSYVHKETWNAERLQDLALELPDILQALQDTSYVAFRYRADA